jgi:hypothetical protein
MTLPSLDDIEERAAIMAEGNGWSQGRAERVLAHEYGFAGWGALLSAVRRQEKERAG